MATIIVRKLHHHIYRLITFMLLHKVAFFQKIFQRRRRMRQNCHILVDIIHNKSMQSGVIRNISEHGAHIAANHAFEIGDKIKLSFPLHYMAPPIEINATIVWTDIGRASLQFDPN